MLWRMDCHRGLLPARCTKTSARYGDKWPRLGTCCRGTSDHLDVRWTLPHRSRVAGLGERRAQQPPTDSTRTPNGYLVEPWVVMVQAINNATEHREQISSMLSALGVTPPDLVGWTYGEVTHALAPIAP
jgi:hypothetical protein